MMQRSLPLFIVLAAAAAVGAYVSFDWLGLGVFLAVLAVGVAGGFLASLWPASPSAEISDLPPATRASARFTKVAHEAAAPAMEPAHAVLVDPHTENLRLTGDILRGMQTGGKTTRGKCSQCSSTLWLSARRPVKARCPVCGFTRVLD
jgi:DNA-directed RNA polymerase subunit RPC12/RpoP